MKKQIFNGLASLILPMGAYAGVSSAGAYQAAQRSYLRAGYTNGMTLDTARVSFLNGENSSAAVTEQETLVLAQGQSVRELMVIDAAVPDKHILYREAKPGVDIIEIDSSAPGLAQLVQVLGRYKNLSALHIVSHAQDGVLLLGNSRITADSIKQEIETFRALNGALRDGGDLLLYGCDLAAGDKGNELLDIVRKNTHLDLAASSNLTGAKIEGGDWDLEIQLGEIESALPFSAKATADFSHVLAGTYTLQNFGYLSAGKYSDTGCPSDRPGYTYGYYSLKSTDTNYTVCGFMGIGPGDSGNGFGGTTVNMSHWFNDVYTPAFLGESGTTASNSGTHAIEVKSSTPFQLTNVVADEWEPDPGGSNGYAFSNVRIVGYVDGGGTIASPAHSAVDDQFTTNTFAFDSVALANFAGVNLTKFRLEFRNDMGLATGMRLVSYTTAPPNTAPTLTAISTLAGATEDTAFTISYADLAAAADEADADGDAISFRVEAVSTGTLTKGGVAVSAGATLLSSGESLVWTPAANANGTLNAFTVRAWDGAAASSSAVQVQATVAAANDAPTATNMTQTVAYTEDAGGSAALGDVVVSDIEAGETITATLTMSNASAGTLTTGTYGSATSTFSVGVWTVSGSVSDVNAALAAVAFTPSPNWDQNLTITTRIRDAADSGPVDGTITLDVTPVNDAPSATNLTQSKAVTEDGGAVALDDVVITDIDTGETVTATLTISNAAAGSLSVGTFGSATSTYNPGPGTGTWTVTGSVADVNAALAAVALTPSADNDQNFTIATRIRDAANTGPADGTISVTVTPVNDAPTDITLSSSTMLQSATAVGADVGTLSSTDVDHSTFTYSLVSAATVADGSCASDTDNASFQINSAVLETAAELAGGSYNLCIQTSDGSAAYKEAFTVTVTDDIAPTISSVSVPANGTYVTGDNLDFTMNVSENATVNTGGGTPRIALTIGATTRYASYVSGSGTSALLFRHTVQSGDMDNDGIAVSTILDANGGTLQDGAGNDLNTTLNSVGTTTSVLVDAVAPSGHSVSFDDATIDAGEAASVSFTFASAEVGADYSYSITSSGGGTPVTGTGTVASASEQISGVDVSGLSEGTLTLSVTFTDSAGNSATAVTDTANLDTSVPTATLVVADSELLAGETSALTITFDGAVSGFTNADLTVAHGSLSTVATADGGITWTATFTPAPDTYVVDSAITLNNTGVVDAAGNAGSGTTDSNTFTVRTKALTLLVGSNLDTGDDETTATSLIDDEADGSGLSLREALFWARTGDRITFDLDSVATGNQGGTIMLNGNQLNVSYAGILDGDLNDDGVADVTVSGNNASRVMNVYANVTGVELDGLILTQGNTGSGGAGLSVGFNAGVTVRNSPIIDNIVTSSSNGGGGIYVLQGSNTTIINSTISGNSSSTFGGGIGSAGTNVTLALVNTTVSNNVTTGAAAHGGGIAFSSSGGSLSLVNTTVSGNAVTGAGSVGGGLRISSATATVYNSTIVGNAATDMGGGVSAEGTDTFVNTVVAGNTSGVGATAGASGSPLATGGTPDDVGGTIETATNSFFGTSATITTDTNNLNNQGTDNLLLGDLADNGGKVLTHRPLTGSALADAGSTAALPADTFDLDNDSDVAEALPLDALGGTRVTGSAVEIGAVEGNQAPELVSLNGGHTFTEGGTPVVIDADVTVEDSELNALNGGNGNYSGASLTVLRNGGANAEDVFGFAAGNGISLATDQLIKNAHAIAQFDTSVTGQVTVTFTDANGEIPTQADVNNILQQLTFANSSENPITSITLDWTFSDEAAATTNGSATIAITPVNDAPTISGTPPANVIAGQPYLFAPVLNDLEGNVLTVSATNLPSWAGLDSATGTITGTPSNNNAGSASNIVLTVSDGNDASALPAFAIAVLRDTNGNGVPDTVDTDDDGDGLPDTVESELGFNPLDANDAGGDADGDGVSNLNEYQDGSDPLTDDYAPVFASLNTIAINATGLLTQLPALEPPVALDGLDGDVEASLATSSNWFKPGVHNLTWTAVDAAGNRAEATQLLHVRPLISLGKDQVRGEGSATSIRFLLNGVSPVYPLAVGYTLAGSAGASDHNLLTGTVVFNAGETEQNVMLLISDDGVAEGEEVLRVNLDAATTTTGAANFGVKSSHDLRIVEQNIAPAVAISLQQDGNEVRIVTQDGGPLIISASVDDPNPNDQHTFDWTLPVSELAASADGGRVIDVSELDAGVYSVAVIVTDDASNPASTHDSIRFRVIATAPTLDAGSDSDDDGLNDATEGLTDSDQDGQPDYLDAISLPNVLNERVNDGGRYLVEADPGVVLNIGSRALVNNGGGAHLNGSDIEVAEQSQYGNVGGYFDFVARQLPELGASVNVVLPQRQALPERALYRKLIDGRWFTFVENANNGVASAPGEQGICPPPGSDAYVSGLNAGHWCVQLTLEDGGPNDADGEANGSVEDPGGVVQELATETTARVSGGGGGGGSINGIGLFMLLSALLYRNRRRLATAAAIAAVSVNSHGVKWDSEKLYIEASLGQATSDWSKSEFTQQLSTVAISGGISEFDDERFAWSLVAGYELNSWLHLEAGWLDWGDVDLQVNALALDTAALENLIESEYPRSGEGLYAGAKLLYPVSLFDQSITLFAKGGLWAWDGEYRLQVGTTSRNFEQGATDIVYGLGANLELSDQIAIGLSVDTVKLDDDPQLKTGASLTYRF